MVVYIHSDYSELYDELDRLESLPGPKAAAVFDMTLAKTKSSVESFTHVITGSLRNSIKSSSAVEGKTWTGTISAGGRSKGPLKVVNYAIYERARGGSHDFFQPVYYSEKDFIDAMKKVLDRDSSD